MNRYATQISNQAYWKKVIIEFSLVFLVFIITFAISSYFNLSDNFFSWAKQYEDSLDIDEFPIAFLAYLAGLLWFANRRMRESSQLINQNHKLLQRVLEVQETERKRLAQDLHDELGQYLNAIKVQATSLLIDQNHSADVRDTTQRIVNTAEHGYQSARFMMQSLRPVALDEFGLAAALEHLVESWRTSQKTTDGKAETSYTLTIDASLDAISNSIGEATNIALFRIVQEALTNIAKHADATEVLIDIQKNQSTLTLNITDNGIGFETTENRTSYGMLGMQERTEALNGQFTLISQPTTGTIIHIEVPIQ